MKAGGFKTSDTKKGLFQIVSQTIRLLQSVNAHCIVINGFNRFLERDGTLIEKTGCLFIDDRQLADKKLAFVGFSRDHTEHFGHIHDIGDGADPVLHPKCQISSVLKRRKCIDQFSPGHRQLTRPVVKERYPVKVTVRNRAIDRVFGKLFFDSCFSRYQIVELYLDTRDESFRQSFFLGFGKAMPCTGCANFIYGKLKIDVEKPPVLFFAFIRHTVFLN